MQSLTNVTSVIYFILLPSTFRVARWCKADIEVSFKLEPKNTSEWQVGAYGGCWSILSVGANEARVLEHPFSWI